MDHFTLNNDDINACIELACDGVNLHLHDQNKLDVIHKILYAVSIAAQSDQRIISQLEVNQSCQFKVDIAKISDLVGTNTIQNN